MNQVLSTVRIAENGRLSIPAKQRRLLGLEEGGLVVLEVGDGALTIRPVRRVLADIQARVRHHLPPGTGTTVETFLAERREEGRQEASDPS